MTDTGETGKIIAGMAHGGHAIADDVRNAKQLAQEGFTLLSQAVQMPVAGGVKVHTTDFDYLFKGLVGEESSHLPAGAEAERIVEALNALGGAMVDDGAADTVQTSTIPPIFTYWGQFVDHDMTAATDTDSPIELSIRTTPLTPVEPRDVRRMLVNARNPALNLDSVYGDGPFAPEPTDPTKVFVPYQDTDPAKLRLGRLSEIPAPRIPPVDDMERDLPRRPDRTPLVGDRRNDENLIVAQLHVAFLRFHNAAVDWVRANEPYRAGVIEVFRRARDLTRFTYQWLCVHDFLTTVALPDAVGRALAAEDESLLERLGRRPMPYIPLEYAVAAYRFGHSMVRASYDWNRNFGQPDRDNATFDQMFQFTGSGGMFGDLVNLPTNWPAEWDRMVDPHSAFPDRFARPIDTHLAPPLGVMRNAEGPANVIDLLKHLARRNLLRGYRLNLPTGQAVAQQLGLPKLSATEITDGLSDGQARAIADGGFAERTPLWYYVLREAEVKTQGNSLGPVGSTIVAETIVAQLRFDKTSYLHQSGQGRYGTWSPHDGVRLPDGGRIDSIRNFLRFAGVL